MNTYTLTDRIAKTDSKAIKELAQDVENFMRQAAAERGLSYISLRGQLARSWLFQPCFDDDEIHLLQQAQICQTAGDTAGFRAAGLAFLMARHGLKIGDAVNLGGSDFPIARNIVIEDFYLELDESDLLTKSMAVFIGPGFCKHVYNTKRHAQQIHELTCRIPN